MAAGELHEIKSSDILQPGPAALTGGVRQLRAIIARWRQVQESNNNLREPNDAVPV